MATCRLWGRPGTHHWCHRLPSITNDRISPMTSQLGDTVFDLAVGRHTDGGLVILAACQNGVFISVDMAETWSGLWLEGMATAIAASPNFASDGVIIAGVYGGII